MKPVENAPKDVDEYVNLKNPKLMPVVRAMEALVREVCPTSSEGLNSWDVPTFSNPIGTFAWFMVNKGHVTFGFDRGTSLPDPNGLLEGTGKNMRHVKLRKVEDLQRPGLKELVAAAVEDCGRVY